jgi:transposase
MTKKQYISQLTQAGRGIQGKDVLEKDRAGVIDGLCEVIAEKDTVIAEKDTKIADQAIIIDAKDADIARLNWIVKKLQRQIYGRRSEKLHPEDPNQLSLDFGEEQVLPVSDDGLKQAEQQVSDAMYGVRKDAEARRAAKKEKSARQRKGMTYRVPVGIPREEPVKHYPEGYTPETMVVIGWNKHETLEIEKPRMYVRQEWDAICKPADAKPTDARTEIVEAAGSQNCLPGCIAGNSLMAVIVTDKWCNHLPEYRQVKRFAAMGVDLSTTSVNRWQHALANRLFALYMLQMELVLSSVYQHIDESTIPINDRKHHTRKGYIWSIVDGMLRYGLVFFYEKGSRGENALRPKLVKRGAAIQSDGYIVYQNIEKDELLEIVTLYCMAHARRKFEAIKDSSPEARKVLEYIAVLYMLEANLKDRNATHDEIRQERQQKAVPILEVLKMMLEKYKTVDTPQSALAQACNYALERWAGLTRYCEEGYYDIDNNIVERSIRPLTLGRKNWLFVDSDESARDTAVYLTLIGSCNMLGIEPYKYFMTILPRLRDNMTKEQLTAMLPYKVAEELKQK